MCSSSINAIVFINKLSPCPWQPPALPQGQALPVHRHMDDAAVRREWDELLLLRLQLRPQPSGPPPAPPPAPPLDSPLDPPLDSPLDPPSAPRATTIQVKTSQPSGHTNHPKTPANPLIDAAIHTFHPVAWIDCIQRTAPRIFLREHFIIARIVLPSHATCTGLRAALD